MAQRTLYDITNQEFSLFINQMSTALSNSKIDYILVGGVATQLHILDILCRQHGLSITEIAEKYRLQDFIRATNDIDLTLSEETYKNSRNEKEYLDTIVAVFDSFTDEDVFSPDENHVLNYSWTRKGARRPKFGISIDSAHKKCDQIMLNIARKQTDLEDIDTKHYPQFIERHRKLSVPYNPQLTIKTKAMSITDLLAVKIAKSRSKDIMDFKNLVRVMTKNNQKIKWKELSQILLPKDQRNYEIFQRITGQLPPQEFEYIN